VWEEVSGSNLVDSPFGFVLLHYIYNMFILPFLAMSLELYPNDLTMDRFSVVLADPPHKFF
jgi:hypothetical protein